MREENSNPKRDYYITMILMSILSILFLALTLMNLYKLFTDLKPQDLHTIKGVITSEPKIIEGRDQDIIKIKLKSIAYFTFVIQHPAIIATKKNTFIDEVQRYDTIEVDIKKSEFELKILKTKGSSMLHPINYSFIPVYGLRKDKSVYLSLDEYSKVCDEEATYTWWGCLIISTGLMIWIYFERKKYKTKYP